MVGTIVEKGMAGKGYPLTSGHACEQRDSVVHEISPQSLESQLKLNVSRKEREKRESCVHCDHELRIRKRRQSGATDLLQ